MNILYVGILTPGWTSAMRVRTLEELGHQVTPLDLHPPWVGQREAMLFYRALRKVCGPLDLAGVNSAIVRHMREHAYDILWLDKAMTIAASTLRRVKQLQPNCKIIGYSLDDMGSPHNQSRRFLSNLPLYDAFFTTKSYGVAELRSLGCPRVEFTGNSYDPHTHRPLELSDAELREYGCDVGFVGTFEEERARHMNYLAEHGVAVQIRGDIWERWPQLHPSIKVKGKSTYGEVYTKAICGTKINLCFLRKINRDLQTQRSVEIPACGAFMLAERTDEHLALFEEGKEAEFFASREELLEKARYYLAHPNERKQIAAAGRQRCLRSGYSYNDRLGEILARVAGVRTPREYCGRQQHHLAP